MQLNHVASAFTMYFTDIPVEDMAAARTSNGKIYTALYKQMRERGIYLGTVLPD